MTKRTSQSRGGLIIPTGPARPLSANASLLSRPNVPLIAIATPGSCDAATRGAETRSNEQSEQQRPHSVHTAASGYQHRRRRRAADLDASVGQIRKATNKYPRRNEGRAGQGRRRATRKSPIGGRGRGSSSAPRLDAPLAGRPQLSKHANAESGSLRRVAQTAPLIETGQSWAKVSLLVEAAAPTARRASTAEFVGGAAAPPGTRLAVPPAVNAFVSTSATALLISEKRSYPADADSSPER
jgi:hypothetical protein